MMINSIAEIASKDDYFKELFNKLEKLVFYGFLKKNNYKQYLFSNKELNDILRFADIFASSNISKLRNYSNRIVSNLYTYYCENKIYNSYAYTIYSKMGLFPTLNIITNDGEKHIDVSNDVIFSENYKKFIQYDKDLDIYYTDKQYEVVKEIQGKNNYSLSAPTSFGKTMIIKNFINEVIKNKKRCNVCILVPTNALLKEISMEMKSKYENICGYKIKVLTYPEIKNKDKQYENLIFVFTPERLVEYFVKNNDDIEYLFVDEAQKILKPNDDRSPVFYNAVSYASFRGTKLFFLSPNIGNPEVFLALSNRDEANLKKITDKLVIQNRYLFNFKTKQVKYLDYSNCLLEQQLDIDIHDISKAIEFIYESFLKNTSTIIYFSSKQKMTEVLLEYLEDKDDVCNEELDKLIKIVSDTIHEKYFLIKALKKGVAYHYGQMPKTIREKIEDLFKRKVIKVLFTTSTLLEGVNIQAKNIILTSDNNGISNLSEEDFLNLIGRAGRFRSELFGNVICIKGDFEKSLNYKYFNSQNVSKLYSDILDNTKGNFYKDIKQIIQKKEILTKNCKAKALLIRQQYANIAILHNKLQYDSKLKSNLAKVNKDMDIFKNVNRNDNGVDKLKKFKEYTSIPYGYQQKIYDKTGGELMRKYKNFHMNNLSYQDIEYLISKIMEDYEFYARKLVPFKRSYIYYSHLVYDWISGKPLNIIINNTIENIEAGRIPFLLDVYFEDNKRFYREYIGSDRQINLIINDILEKVEDDIKHLVKLYVSNYVYLNIENDNFSKSLEMLIDYIEFGTKNTFIIELQKYGFSRELSLYANNKHKECFIFDEFGLEDIDFKKLFKDFDKSNILYEELKEYEYLVTH